MGSPSVGCWQGFRARSHQARRGPGDPVFACSKRPGAWRPTPRGTSPSFLGTPSWLLLSGRVEKGSGSKMRRPVRSSFASRSAGFESCARQAWSAAALGSYVAFLIEASARLKLQVATENRRSSRPQPVRQETDASGVTGRSRPQARHAGGRRRSHWCRHLRSV